MPSKVMIFYSEILKIVRFDIMEKVFKFDELVGWIFELPDEAVNEDAESLGYGSQFIITNLAAPLVFFIILMCIYFIFTAFYGILSLAKAKPGKAMMFAKEWKDAFKWNGLI